MNAGQLHGLLAASVAVVAALLLVPACRLLALALGVVDKPGGRKDQQAPVPLLGGVAVLLAAMAGALYAARNAGGAHTFLAPEFMKVVAAGGLIFLIGLVDDLFKDKVGPLPKFIGQFCGVVLLFGDRFANVLAGDATFGEGLHLAATTLWFLTVVNAVNFVDNMNGLCAGLSMTSFLVGLFGLSGGADGRYTLIAGGLGGALLGFLPYNYPKARIYLGDAGSHLAGFFLALVTLEFTGGFLSAGARFFGLDAFVPAMLLLGLPLFDLLFSVVHRWRERRPLFAGDARHLSHRLAGAGLDKASAVMLLWGVHLILAAWGVMALEHGAIGRYAMIAVILLFLGVLSSILVRIESKKRSRQMARSGETSSVEIPARKAPAAHGRD